MSDHPQNDGALQHLLSHTPAEVLGMLMAEVRRPTYSIQNCAEMLIREELSPEAKAQALQVIKGNTQHLIQLVMLAWDYLEQHTGMPNPYRDE
jgi:hypothetical protein